MYKVERLSFSIISSILTFDFELILGYFFLFGPYWAILGVGVGSKTVLGSTHVVEQFSFSIIPLILTFDFDLTLGIFFYFLGP